MNFVWKVAEILYIRNAIHTAKTANSESHNSHRVSASTQSQQFKKTQLFHSNYFELLNEKLKQKQVGINRVKTYCPVNCICLKNSVRLKNVCPEKTVS